MSALTKEKIDAFVADMREIHSISAFRICDIVQGAFELADAKPITDYEVESILKLLADGRPPWDYYRWSSLEGAFSLYFPDVYAAYQRVETYKAELKEAAAAALQNKEEKDAAQNTDSADS